jgi:hypothetical protein
MAEKRFAREVKVFVVARAAISSSLGFQQRAPTTNANSVFQFSVAHCQPRSEVSRHGSQEKSRKEKEVTTFPPNIQDGCSREFMVWPS